MQEIKKARPRQAVQDVLSAMSQLQIAPEQQLQLETTLNTLLVEFLRPQEQQLRLWKHDPNGYQHFICHLNATLNGSALTQELQWLLWEYYTGSTCRHPRLHDYGKINAPMRCTCCGKTTHLQVDHKVPLAIGGSNSSVNLHYLCSHCNQVKSGRIAYIDIFDTKI